MTLTHRLFRMAVLMTLAHAVMLMMGVVMGVVFFVKQSEVGLYTIGVLFIVVMLLGWRYDKHQSVIRQYLISQKEG